MKKEDILDEVNKYFNGDDLAANVWADKYALKDQSGNFLEKTPDDMHRRISSELARIEQNYPNPISEEDIYNLLKNFKYIIPQGSPMYGIGNNMTRTSLSNCFVVGSNNKSDSYGSIMRTDEEQIQLMKRRGGVGHDLSHLRPAGALANNTVLGGLAGATLYMDRYSHSTREVAQDGRRGALMLSISVEHPDAEKFIDMKMTKGKVTGANVSVKMTDAFMKAVKENTDFYQTFPVGYDISSYTDRSNMKYNKLEKHLFTNKDGQSDIVYIKRVKAKEIWDKVIHNAWKSAEPGVFFWDKILRESPADMYGENWQTVTTNPSLRGDTLVNTKEGIIPIKELDGKDVIVKNILGEWQPAKAFMSGKNKELWKIELTNGELIYATAEHKHPIVNKRHGLINKTTGKVNKKRTDELKKYDKLYFPTFKETPINVNNNYTKIDGFTAGWLTGDGWVSWHKSQETFLYGFIFSKEDHSNNIHQIILDNINDKLVRKITLRKNKDYYETSTSSHIIDKYFKEDLGLTHKSNGLPEYIWKSNHDFISGYIDGLFSSDGYVDIKRNRIILTSKYQKLLTDTQKLLGFYGIRCNIHEGFTKLNGKKYIRYDLHILNTEAIKFAERFNLTHQNKNNKLQEIINKGVTGKLSNNRNYQSIKSITKTNLIEDVYDITVFDETHTFQLSNCITGNCGEIPLCPYDSCRLLVQNLYSYVVHPFTNKAYFDFELFRKHVHIAQRFMDDIIDLELEKIDTILAKINSDPEDEDIKKVERNVWLKIRQKALDGRRTGLGITAEGDMLAALGLKYGTPEGIDFSVKVHQAMTKAAYLASTDLAEERGKFPMWDYETEKDNSFLNRVYATFSAEELAKVKKFGRRNISLLTIAPTGTTSLMSQTTSGIEPLFLPWYVRRRKTDDPEKSVFVDEMGDMWEEYMVFHPQFVTWFKVAIWDKVSAALGVDDPMAWLLQCSDDVKQRYFEQSPYYGATSADVDWKSSVTMQGKVQDWVDHSISKTINLPEDVDESVVNELYLEAHEAGCKGVTVYREGSRSGVLKSKSDDTPSEKFGPKNAMKRPREVMSDIYFPTIKGEKYFVSVGIVDGYPYETFAYNVNGTNINENINKGVVKKRKSGWYDLYSEDMSELIIENFAETFSAPDEEDKTRLISGWLRTGGDMKWIVDTLNKSRGELGSFSKVIARQLKKYIQDGETSSQKCPHCGANLVFEEGCLHCTSCGKYNVCG